MSEKIQVEALRKGYFENILRNPGDKFHITSEKQLGSWMKPLNGYTPKKEVEAELPEEEISEEVSPLDGLI